MNSFKKNLICWLFGHVLPSVPINYDKTSLEKRAYLMVHCERCETFKMLIEFRTYKKFKKYDRQ